MNRIVKEDIANIVKEGADMWPQLKGKRVLVTGASGLIGYYLCETLRAIGSKVVALARNEDKLKKRFIGANDIELVAQDVSDKLDIGPVDYIIHAASQASNKYYKTDPVGTFLANTLGTANLLHLAYKHKAKFMFISGGEIYGTGQISDKPTEENRYGWLDPLDVRSCYPESKRAGENLCSCWKAQYNVPFVIARLAHTYGPGFNMDGRVFSDFVRNVIEGRDIELNSDGSAVRSFCYISDAVIGLFMILLRGKNGSAYNLCNEDSSVSILELAKIISTLVNKKVGVKILSHTKDVRSNSRLSSAKLRALGWNPVIGLHEGFSRTINSIISNI